jgi:hypothetical protein
MPKKLLILISNFVESGKFVDEIDKVGCYIKSMSGIRTVLPILYNGVNYFQQLTTHNT